MTKLPDIEISKSIETGRLIRKHDWLDVMDTILFAIIFIGLLVYSLFMFLQIDFQDPKDRVSFLTILLPVIFLFALYGLYRTLIGNRLTSIETSFEQRKNHDLLCSFLKDFQYDVSQNSKEIIIVNDESELSYNGLWSKDITFIISERKIFFNIVKIYPIISPPVLFSHLILKHDLKKYFSKNH
ncbi:MAG: hypothetical protein ABI207_02200 [Crocinitomicaceae bacterium]